MQFPDRFSDLPDYAFPRLRKLLDAHAPGADPVAIKLAPRGRSCPEKLRGFSGVRAYRCGIYAKARSAAAASRSRHASAPGDAFSRMPQDGTPVGRLTEVRPIRLPIIVLRSAIRLTDL